MRAYDDAGNYRTSSPAYNPVILQETAAAKSGSWTTRSSTSYLGGTSYSSGTKGASLTWTFTGRSAGLAVSRGATSGKIGVYLDGQPAGTLNLRAASTLHRQAIWARNWGISGRHTVKVVVRGPAVLDGLVVLR